MATLSGIGVKKIAIVCMAISISLVAFALDWPPDKYINVYVTAGSPSPAIIAPGGHSDIQLNMDVDPKYQEELADSSPPAEFQWGWDAQVKSSSSGSYGPASGVSVTFSASDTVRAPTARVTIAHEGYYHITFYGQLSFYYGGILRGGEGQASVDIVVAGVTFGTGEVDTFLNGKNHLTLTVTPGDLASYLSLNIANGSVGTFSGGSLSYTPSSASDDVDLFGGNIYGSGGTVGDTTIHPSFSPPGIGTLDLPDVALKSASYKSNWLSLKGDVDSASNALGDLLWSAMKTGANNTRNAIYADPGSTGADQAAADSMYAAAQSTTSQTECRAFVGAIIAGTFDQATSSNMATADTVNKTGLGNINGLRLSGSTNPTLSATLSLNNPYTVIANSGWWTHPYRFIDQIGMSGTYTIDANQKFSFGVNYHFSATAADITDSSINIPLSFTFKNWDGNSGTVKVTPSINTSGGLSSSFFVSFSIGF